MSATKARLQGYFKEVYEKLERATPGWAILQDKIPFQARKRLGDTYNFPVKLRHSHGFTVAGGSDVGTAFDLNAPVSLLLRNAQLSAATIVGQEDIPYDVIAMAQEMGEAAFGDAMDEIVFGLREGHHFHQEMHLLHGGQNIGVVDGAPSVSGDTATVTISIASFAPGLWAAAEGMEVDVYNAAGATLRNATGTVSVGAVDLAPGTRTVELVCSVTAEASDIADTDIIVPRGAQGAWSPGLRQIASDTSTVLHNIDPTLYALWRPNVEAAGSVKLSMALVQQMLTSGMVRGLDEKVTCIVSPYSWSDVNNDLAALRRFTSDMRAEAQLGTKSIKFYGVTGAEVELLSHPMMKTGDAIAFPEKRMRRVGASDVTNKIKRDGGDSPDNFYQDLETKAACRIRTYSNQALVAKQRARVTIATGIVPTAFGT